MSIDVMIKSTFKVDKANQSRVYELLDRQHKVLSHLYLKLESGVAHVSQTVVRTHALRPHTEGVTAVAVKGVANELLQRLDTPLTASPFSTYAEFSTASFWLADMNARHVFVLTTGVLAPKWLGQQLVRLMQRDCYLALTELEKARGIFDYVPPEAQPELVFNTVSFWNPSVDAATEVLLLKLDMIVKIYNYIAVHGYEKAATDMLSDLGTNFNETL